jgi:acetyl-CoA carboxylase biotin carboxyl carrier protein
MAKFTVDSDLVRTLAELLTETGLTEVEITDGDRTIRVARQGHLSAASETPTDQAMASEAEVRPDLAAGPNHPGALTSPMVGTVFVAPQPGADPFVQAGDHVDEGQTLLIIEAMKVMNPIPASRSGTVRSILVEDGQPVEFGEALLVIE